MFPRGDVTVHLHPFSERATETRTEEDRLRGHVHRPAIGYSVWEARASPATGKVSVFANVSFHNIHLAVIKDRLPTLPLK